MEKKLVALAIFLFVLPLVTAQLESFVPSEWLNNPIVVFIVFFALFFAAIYFSVGRTMGGNIVIPAIISAAISFVVAAGVQGQWQFMQRPMMFWAMLFAAALVIAIIVLGFTKYGGLEAGLGIVAGIYGIWPIIKSSLGYETVYRMPQEIVRFLDATWWIGLIIAIIMLFYAGYAMRMRWRHRWIRV